MGKKLTSRFFPQGKNGPARFFPGEKPDWGEIPACFTGTGADSTRGQSFNANRNGLSLHSFFASLLCVLDKWGIFNIMWKSTSIFIGTGRLTVEDYFAPFYQLITKLVQEGNMGLFIRDQRTDILH